MHAKVKWTDGVQFVAESGSGHALIVDGSLEAGGRNTGPRPMELLLMGLGACSSYDVVTILKKSRQAITDCQVSVEAERVDAIPAIFSKIHLHFLVTGKDLKEAQVERAVTLSAEKYCSASIMLGNGGVKITHSHEVVEV